MSFINAFAKKAEEAFKEGKEEGEKDELNDKLKKEQTLQDLLNDAKNEINELNDKLKKEQVKKFEVTYHKAEGAVERWKNKANENKANEKELNDTYKTLNKKLNRFVIEIDQALENLKNEKEINLDSIEKLNSDFENILKKT